MNFIIIKYQNTTMMLYYTFKHLKRRYYKKLTYIYYNKSIASKMTELIRIPNIEKYTQEIINGELILTPKKQYITENELNMTQIAYSAIEKCIIKKEGVIISTNNNYRSVLIDVWKSMPTQKILQTTTFNFKLTKETGEKGYNWCDVINMSFQNKDATGSLKEIVNMVKVNNLTIDLSIKLETGGIVNFKIE
jgi:hypothetical protein